jgi:hypothetical protein
MLNLSVFLSLTTALNTPIPLGLKSIGTAVKQAQLEAGVEKTVFEHTLSPTATHGVMTQAWHAGKSSGITPELRIRYYIDGETTASVDYPLFLAHGTGPARLQETNLGPTDVPGTPTSKTGPWGNSLFGRTHDSGWYNNYLVPFGKSIRITLTDPHMSSPFWYMCRGAENLPLVVSGLTLPTTARLQLIHTQRNVKAGSLVTFANVTGKSGLLRQTNLVINSADYSYQEGCVSARVDGDNALWLSSGLEDYFLGAYFHTMPTQHLPFSGFQNLQPATKGPSLNPTNSLVSFSFLFNA